MQNGHLCHVSDVQCHIFPSLTNAVLEWGRHVPRRFLNFRKHVSGLIGHFVQLKHDLILRFFKLRRTMEKGLKVLEIVHSS